MWTQVTAAAIFSMIGVALGAALQHYFGRALESRKQLTLQRSQAYADYFKAVALLAQCGRKPDYLAMVADAKVRVCMYGSPEVIKRLGEFEAAGAAVTTPLGNVAIIALLSEMRKDTGTTGGDLEPKVLQAIVLGPHSTARVYQPPLPTVTP